MAEWVALVVSAWAVGLSFGLVALLVRKGNS